MSTGLPVSCLLSHKEAGSHVSALPLHEEASSGHNSERLFLKDRMLKKQCVPSYLGVWYTKKMVFILGGVNVLTSPFFQKHVRLVISALLTRTKVYLLPQRLVISYYFKCIYHLGPDLAHIFVLNFLSVDIMLSKYVSFYRIWGMSPCLRLVYFTEVMLFIYLFVYLSSVSFETYLLFTCSNCIIFTMLYLI